jgi:hypothetical protein
MESYKTKVINSFATSSCDLFNLKQELLNLGFEYVTEYYSEAISLSLDNKKMMRDYMCNPFSPYDTVLTSNRITKLNHVFGIDQHFPELISLLSNVILYYTRKDSLSRYIVKHIVDGKQVFRFISHNSLYKFLDSIKKYSDGKTLRILHA